MKSIDPELETTVYLEVSEPQNSYLDQSQAFSACPPRSSGLCCAAHTPRPQDKLSHLATDEPAGSSHLIPVVTSLAWPFSKSFGRTSNESILQDQSCFLVRKLYICWNDWKGELPAMKSFCSAQYTTGKSIWALSDAAQIWGAQHLKGCRIYLSYVES